MSPFRLQYASNLFVDLAKQPFHHLVTPAANTLALLGNIGRPENPKTYHFLNYCAKNWDSVLWIPGPHDISNPKGGRATSKEKLRNMHTLAKQIPRLTIMDSKERVFHDQRVVLLGTPLWTHLTLPPRGQPEFQSIFTSVDEAGCIPLCHNVRNHWHKEDMQFLHERSLFWTIVNPGVQLVYLTHTLPSSLLLQPPIGERQWARLYMDMMHPSIEPPLRAWLGGASGSTHTVNIGTEPHEQVKCGVNSLYEYPFNGLIQKNHYDPMRVLELNPKEPAGISVLSLPNVVLPPLLSSLLKPKLSLGYA
jgi:hypothetical protein